MRTRKRKIFIGHAYKFIAYRNTFSKMLEILFSRTYLVGQTPSRLVG